MHVGLMEGSGDVTFPWYLPICTSVQLPFIYLNLSAILVPSGRFSCRSQVSYHIFVYYFIAKTRAGDRTKWYRTKWHGQNGIWTKWYGQNGTDKMVVIFGIDYNSSEFNSYLVTKSHNEMLNT